MIQRAGTVLLALASLALALLAAELLVRALDIGPHFQVVFRESVEPSDDPQLGYALRPGARDGRSRISQAGLRDREYEHPKPAGVFRIVTIGDSVTYGSGGPREAAWGEQLEALLERFGSGARFEVLNLGVPGYHIGQSVQRLRVTGLAFEPDLVLYGYVLNDPQAFSVESAAIEALRERARSAPLEAEPSAWRRILSHSRLFLLTRHFTPQRGNARTLRDSLPPDPAYAASKGTDPAAYFRRLHESGDSAQRLVDGLATLGRIASEQGIPARVVVFPLFSDDGRGPASPADVHARVASIASRSGLAAIDLVPAFERARATGQTLAMDFLHPNPLGARIAAGAVLEALCETHALPAGAVDCATASDAFETLLAR